MEVEKVLHMTTGDGATSYANNSSYQKTVIEKTRAIVEDTITDAFSSNFPNCFKVADLGCSSGPNTLLTVSQIIDIIYGLCQQRNCKLPEFQFFLNDLPGNDFNAIFKSVPAFHKKLKKEKGDKLGPCFITGMPGSFYDRLFPTKSIDFIHSSYSLHWLSKVPEGLANNKGNIYMAKTSPSNVFKAYEEQFQRDFSMFLNLRSEEIISRGRMILIFICRSTADPSSKECCHHWELLAKSLLEMVPEITPSVHYTRKDAIYLKLMGLVKEADIDSFNIPLYTPFKEEVRSIIQEEGSFDLDRLEILENNPNNGVDTEHFGYEKCHTIAQTGANTIRAISESMLASQFGETVIDNLFERYARHMFHYFCTEKVKIYNVVISLTRK